MSDSDERPSGTSRLQLSTSPRSGGPGSRYNAGAGRATAHRRRGRGLDLSNLAVLYLDIPLADPAACRAIHRRGTRLLLAALLPDARPDGDVLRLQRLADIEIDTTHIQTVTDLGADVVAFVLSERERAEGILAARDAAH